MTQERIEKLKEAKNASRYGHGERTGLPLPLQADRPTIEHLVGLLAKPYEPRPFVDAFVCFCNLLKKAPQLATVDDLELLWKLILDFENPLFFDDRWIAFGLLQTLVDKRRELFGDKAIEQFAENLRKIPSDEGATVKEGFVAFYELLCKEGNDQLTRYTKYFVEAFRNAKQFDVVNLLMGYLSGDELRGSLTPEERNTVRRVALENLIAQRFAIRGEGLKVFTFLKDDSSLVTKPIFYTLVLGALYCSINATFDAFLAYFMTLKATRTDLFTEDLKSTIKTLSEGEFLSADAKLRHEALLTLF